MSNLKRPFLMGTAAAGAALVVSAFFSILAVSAACTNPATIPSGFTAPCPVFSLSATTVTQAQILTLSATPQAGTDYIYTQAYVSNGTTWNPYTLAGNNAYPSYSSALASFTLSSTQLSSLSLGTHYAVVWDWLWDATAGCYKGPGLNQCNTGAWRVQSFSVTSAATPTPTPTSTPSPYTYSQSAYYAYSQSAYVTPTPTPTPLPGQSLFTTQTPTSPNQSDGVNYELGMRFIATTAGNLTGIRFWKASSETGGTHVGHIWNASGTLLASVTFTGETASGWQQQALASTLAIAANTTYTVSVNTVNTYFAYSVIGTNTPVVNGYLQTISGNYGYYASSPGTYPASNAGNQYFRDVVFVAGSSYAYSQSAYYAYSQSSYYTYSQSSYYAYSQSAYVSGVNNYYITTAGSDSNPCTQTSPCLTINSVDSRLGGSLALGSGGTTIHLASGTYTFNPLQTNHNGTASARIVYISDAKWGAKIGTNGWVENGAYVDISNLEITGISIANYGIIIAASEVHVLGNKIHDVPAPGCTSEGGAAIYNEATGGFQFSNNLIFNIGYPANSAPCPRVHGIYLHEGRGGTISNNIIYNNIGWGIHVYNPGTEVVQNNIYTNNTIYGNFYGGMLLAGGESTAPDGGNVIANNIIQNNGLGAGGSGYGILEGSADPSNVGGYTGVNTYTDNLIYNNSPANLKLCTSIYTGCTAVNTPSGTVSVNALLVSPVTDFHLQSTSPAINAGTSTNAPATDFDGISRPQGVAWDIGAYEYH